MTSIVCDVMHLSPPLLGGFSALLTEQEGSWKGVQSAETSLSHRDVLYCSKPAGNTTAVRVITALMTVTFYFNLCCKIVHSGEYMSNKVPGFNWLACDSFGTTFLRINLDRYV